MGLDPSELSVEQIRARWVESGQPVTSHLLNRLKRDRRRGVRRIYEHLRRRHERDREEALRLDAMLNFERVLWRSGIRRVAGVDEAGTGPLAGPVVAAAVVFAPDTRIDGVDDSKRLEPERRTELAARIREVARGVGVGVADVEEIDRLNIYHAALLAMRRAVEALPEAPEHVLVDARAVPGVRVPQNCFQKGDGINFSIAAASIVAKTHRDALLDDLDRRHPGYGLARHKGYATAQHRRAIRELGPSPVHRRSFTVIQELRGEYSPRFYDLRRTLDAVASASELQLFEKELEGSRETLALVEQRKLRLLVARRWKAL